MVKKVDTILSEALQERGLVPKDRLDNFLKEADALGQNLTQILVKNGLLHERDILAILSEKLKLSCLELKTAPIDKSVIDKIPFKIASYYKFLPLAIKGRTLTIAVSSPLDLKTQDEIRMQTGYAIETVLSCEADISESLKRHYGSMTETLEKIASGVSGVKAPPAEAVERKVDDLEKLAEDASVIKLVNQIILEAHRKRATDIHIEPYREKVALRYRIDGLLYDYDAPREIRNFLNAIISRIKIMSNLNIVERRLPQDGRAVVRVQDQVLDLRISTMPTPYGESVVIRILPATMLFSLEKLGLSKPEMEVFEKLIRQPHGIIFVTGPTGSGKTTTLYTCLSRLNTKARKIITIEDPIEYELEGITQIQVAPEIGLDFARGLRSMLRHDPDVIMVGEVRDLETAEIAIRVALTGHLVFSTLHTNDAASAITRLIDIGVEPYLVCSSVEAFIAQRLIRLICQDCKSEDKSAPAEVRDLVAADLGLNPKEVTIFKGKGCANCDHTGFFGRTAIYEILLTDDTIKDLILKKVSSSQIKKVAVSRGMRTLRQDGWQKVLAGLTTPDEVMNVTSAEGVHLPLSSNETPAQPPGLDKRAYSRLSKKIGLRYEVFKSKDEALKRGFKPEQLSVSKNISGGGMLFIADEPFPIGSILELGIELPDGKKPIECLARVVRIEETSQVNKYDIAICFLDISSSDRLRITFYIETEQNI